MRWVKCWLLELIIRKTYTLITIQKVFCQTMKILF